MPSLGFLMIRVLTASPAELLELQTIWSRFLVLRRYVIAALAITALQYNVIAWHYSTSPISNLKSEIRKQKTIRLHHSPYRRPPCGHLHGSRSATPSPSQSARSTQSPSAHCRRA